MDRLLVVSQPELDLQETTPRESSMNDDEGDFHNVSCTCIYVCIYMYMYTCIYTQQVDGRCFIYRLILLRVVGSCLL